MIMPTSAMTEVLILGGGIVGAACADACTRAGLTTQVVVRDVVGGGATAAGMGHLVVMDDSEAQFALTSLGVALWRARAASLPAAAEYDPCGTLWLATDASELEAVARRRDFFLARGVRAELIDAVALRALEPNLCDDLAGALLVPDDGVVYPPAAARHFLDAAVAGGARVELGDVVQIEPTAVMFADGRRLNAQRVVVAAGVGSSALVPGLPVRPRKGHLAITDRYPAYVRHQLVESGYLRSAHGGASDSVAFNVQPRRTGQLLLGSSRQFDDADPGVVPSVLDRLVRRAQRFLPGVGELNLIRCWTGMRPTTPDHLPLIGRAASGLWFATGHEGLGITTATATAALLADLIRGWPPAIPAAPYRPDRFAEVAIHD